jgi:hypothetical protein
MLQNSGHVSWSWFIMMKCYQHRKKPSLSVHWLLCPMFHALSYFGRWETDEPAPTMHIPPCHCEKSMFRKEGWSYLVTMFKSLFCSDCCKAQVELQNHKSFLKFSTKHFAWQMEMCYQRSVSPSTEWGILILNERNIITCTLLYFINEIGPM